jgi:hypothetical protein
MKRFLPFFAFALLLDLAVSCKEKPDPEKPVKLVVNKLTTDSELSFSADPQTLSFDVYCDGEWDMREEGTPASWVLDCSVSDQRKHTWTVSFQVTENTSSDVRRAVFVFYSGSVERRVTLVQSVEDPILRVHEPGAYGVPGGDVVYDPDRSQYSLLFYGEEGLSVRFLEPDAAQVTILSGLSRKLETGMQFQLLYRKVERGYTRVLETVPVQVIRIQDSLVWLKKDDNLYFVIRK